LILISSDLDALFAARDICAHQKPLLYPITAENIDAAIPRIKQKPTPVAIRGEGVESLIPLTTKLKDAGIEEIVLDPGSKNLKEAVRDQTLMRRAALKHGFRLLGYPTIAFPCFTSGDSLEEVLTAAAFIDKYAAIIVLSDMERDSLYPLLVQRLNIYTDPRRPMTVEEKIYEINEPTIDSPVLVTTNFALTYFTVSSEIEGSNVPSFLCVKDTEGLGVLAAWSTGKFTGDTVGPFLKKCGIADKVENKRVIIPGFAARIRGELEDELPGWEVVVGPREASDIPAWLPVQVVKW
jgi:acetyl-CoA decarbonylase/synthase complex subunit gamma